MKLIHPWTAIVPGDKYATQFSIGAEVPEALEEAAIKAGVVGAHEGYKMFAIEEVEKLGNELEATQLKLKESETQLKAAAKYSKEVDDKLEMKSSEFEDLTKKLKTSDDTFEDVNSKLLKAETKVAELSSSLKDAKKAAGEFEQKSKDLEAKVNKLEAELSAKSEAAAADKDPSK